MTIARAFRYLLSFVAVAIVGWSFFDVGHRAVMSYRAEHARPITLTILHWGDPTEDRIVQSQVNQFEQEHPAVHIVRINPGSTDYEGKLRTMLAAGTPPDLFYLRAESMPELAAMNLITPLDDRFAREPARWRDDFFSMLIDGFRYNLKTERYGKGGTLYGIPKDFTPAVFYVNLDLFKQAGVAVPYKGWTWDDFEADMKKIRALNGSRGFEGRQIYGGTIELWPDMLRNLIWTFGGDFFGPGGFRDVRLDSPAAQAAMQLVVRTRLIDKTVYNPTGIAKDGGQEFFNGNIGCDGPLGCWKVPLFQSITNFRWDCVPIPHEVEQASISFYTAWTMSTGTKHPEEAYQLLKYLCGSHGQIQNAQLSLCVPSLKSIAYSANFLSAPGLINHNGQVFLDEIPYTRIQQLPRQLEWSRIVADKIAVSLQLGQVSTMECAREIKKAWLAELDSPLRQQEWKPMRWGTILSITAALLATLITLFCLRAKREKLGALDLAQQRAGWMFIAPWLVGFLGLTLGPMIASLLLSFTKWSGMNPIGAAESVGTANFRQLIFHDTTFYQSLRVTLYFVVVAVPIGQIAALAVALLMNVRVRGITTFRTIYFVPSVVSGVALAVLWMQIFNNDYGLLNRMLRPLLSLFHTTPPDWFGTDAKIWAIPAFVIMGLWGVGGGMIIYLAGLKGIPMSLYEAATIDGAGAARKFYNVTLPMLSPLIFYNLVMGIIASFQVFTQAYVMTGPGPDNATLFYVLNLYQQAFEFHNMGYASAMAWVLFLIVLALTLLVFRGSRKLVYYEGLKA